MGLFFRTKKSEWTDEELLRKYRSSGERALFGEFYSRYVHLVYGVCLKYFKDREVARDAAVQLFEKLMVSLKQNEPENVPSWLLFVARNHCISELRKHKVMRERSEQFEADEQLWYDAEDRLSPEEKEQRLLRLEHAVNTLGEEQRQCIELFYFKEKSYEEIATLTGFSEKQVKSHLQNGKRNLRLALGLSS